MRIDVPWPYFSSSDPPLHQPYGSPAACRTTSILPLGKMSSVTIFSFHSSVNSQSVPYNTAASSQAFASYSAAFASSPLYHRWSLLSTSALETSQTVVLSTPKVGLIAIPQHRIQDHALVTKLHFEQLFVQLNVVARKELPIFVGQVRELTFDLEQQLSPNFCWHTRSSTVSSTC